MDHFKLFFIANYGSKYGFHLIRPLDAQRHFADQREGFATAISSIPSENGRRRIGIYVIHNIGGDAFCVVKPVVVGEPSRTGEEICRKV